LELIGLGNVVSLVQARRRRAAEMRSDFTAIDPPMVARVLCRCLATVGSSHSFRLDAVVKQTKIPQEKMIAAAVYAHIRGWVVYSTDGVMLTETGCAVASERA